MMSSDPGQQYRLRSQAQIRRAEGINAGPEAPIGKARQTSSTSVWGLTQWIIAGLAVVAFVAMVVMGTSGVPWLTTGGLALLALVPLLGVTVLLTWIDRWASVGWGYQLLAIFLGAGLGAGGAVVINTALNTDFLLFTGDPERSSFLSAVFVAPFSEEFFKGLGVALVLILARNHLSSPISGAAVGGLVGAGFAYVENIMYFLQAHAQGSEVLRLTFFARGVMSPFIHPMATSFTGVAIAVALLYRCNVWGWVWRVSLGFAAAVATHMQWNYLASLGSIDWLTWYFVIEVPLLIAWLVWLLVWSSRQARTVAAGLESYVISGWVTEGESRMATNRYAWKYARVWARRIGPPAPKKVRRFVKALRRLGLDQVIMTRTGPSAPRIERDNSLMVEVSDLRGDFDYLTQTRGSNQ